MKRTRDDDTGEQLEWTSEDCFMQQLNDLNKETGDKMYTAIVRVHMATVMKMDPKSSAFTQAVEERDRLVSEFMSFQKPIKVHKAVMCFINALIEAGFSDKSLETLMDTRFSDIYKDYDLEWLKKEAKEVTKDV